MAFNHYAKIKRIISDKEGWYIVKIDKKTSAKNFKGETRYFDHYYRIYDIDNKPIKFCKFQQINLLASILNKKVEELPLFDDVLYES